MGYPAYCKPDHSHCCHRSYYIVQGAGWSLPTDGEAQGQGQPGLDLTESSQLGPPDLSGLGPLAVSS